MVNMIMKMFKIIFSVLKVPLFILVAVILIFLIMIGVHIIILTIKGEKRRPSIRIRQKKRSLLLRLFWDAPKQYVRDLYDKEPDFFEYQGLYIYEGRQGAGKTVGVVQHCMSVQKEFPLAKCITNIKYEYQDEILDHWLKLTNYTNEHRGVIVVMDELQNWFGSNMSRDFPPEMMEVISQNRKNRRLILATAQNFSDLAKPIRKQTVEVRKCLTLAKCMTFIFRKEPFLNSEGDVEKWKFRGMYMFVHDKFLRECYDTYEVVESLSKSGFKKKLLIERE